MEPIFHLLIPPLLLMAFFPKLNKKLILVLTPFTFIMDFDSLIPGYHRVIFHNLLFVIIVSLAIYFLLGKIPSLVSAYFLASHLIFDIREWGIALLYPFYAKFIYLTSKITEKQGDFIFNFKLSTTQVTAQQLAVSQHHVFTEIGFMVLFLVIVLIIAWKLKK